jgi:hypothetical protein
MRRMLIRYKTKPDLAQENQRLIENVFQELQARKPDGLRYMVLKVGEGDFVHFVEQEGATSSLTGTDAFREFQSGVMDRCLEAPKTGEASIIGNYRMLSET